MNVNEYIDYTNLKTDATEEDIKKLIDTAIENKCKSVCIPPCFVKMAKEYAGNKMKVCTVIGFPNGYSTFWVKMFELNDAIENGADELDVVININDVKAGKYNNVLEELTRLAAKAKSEGKILKVIIETCMLTDDEIKKMCEIVYESGADFIKTSTGFSKAGVEERTFIILADEVNRLNGTGARKKLRIKASGGIRTREMAEKLICLKADRLGCSKIFSDEEVEENVPEKDTNNNQITIYDLVKALKAGAEEMAKNAENTVEENRNEETVESNIEGEKIPENIEENTAKSVYDLSAINMLEALDFENLSVQEQVPNVIRIEAVDASEVDASEVETENKTEN